MDAGGSLSAVDGAMEIAPTCPPPSGFGGGLRDSSSLFGGPPPLPKDSLEEVLDFQSFDGSFKWNTQLASILKVDATAVETGNCALIFARLRFVIKSF